MGALASSLDAALPMKPPSTAADSDYLVGPPSDVLGGEAGFSDEITRQINPVGLVACVHMCVCA
jgi:hypothetical protein